MHNRLKQTETKSTVLLLYIEDWTLDYELCVYPGRSPRYKVKPNLIQPTTHAPRHVDHGNYESLINATDASDGWCFVGS